MTQPHDAAPSEGPEVSFRLTPFTKGQPDAILHGIRLAADGDPIIPSLGQLLQTAEQNPTHFEFQWLCEDKKWVPIMFSERAAAPPAAATTPAGTAPLTDEQLGIIEQRAICHKEALLSRQEIYALVDEIKRARASSPTEPAAEAPPESEEKQEMTTCPECDGTGQVPAEWFGGKR